MLQSPARFTVIDEEPGIYAFATHKNVNLIVWVGGARGETTDRIQELVAAQMPSSPHGLSTVHVMTHLSQPPSAEARSGFAEIARRWEDTIVSVSLVVEREGFWGAAMRSAVTGVQMLLQRGGYPVKVHASVAETAAWMPQHHLARSGVRLEPGEFLAALEGVRSYAIDKAESLSDAASDLSRSA